MIKNIVFDVGMVLVDFKWRQVMADVGCTEEEIETIAAVMVNSLFWNELDRGVMDEEDVIAQMIDKLPGLKVGAIADFFHLAIEEKNIPESILASKGYIKEVHLGDNNRLLPGYGSIDWAACIRALKEIEYDGYLALECGIDDPEAFTRRFIAEDQEVRAR
jgi:sugar phosphate isomerase/epimerase